MASAARRIDLLYCTRESADERARSILAEIEKRCEAARQEVSTAIAERIEALQERQKELIAQINRVAKQKANALQGQLQTIEAGTCPAAPVENPDKEWEVDPNKFMLCADASIEFKIGEEDFLEKIPDLGSITEVSTYAARSFARGPALGVAKVSNPSTLWVYACGKDGARRTEGGDSVVASFCQPEAFSQLEVEDMKDGRYKVSFVPCQEGEYSLTVTIASKGQQAEEVREGPFAVVVRPATDFQHIGDAGSEEKPRIGEHADATGTLGTMGHPSGLAFDHTGRFLFVADQGNHRIQVFDTLHGNVPVSAFGKKGLGPHELDTPCDVAVDNENRVVVTDLLNHRLQVLEFVTLSMELRHVRSVTNGFQFPKGVCITDAGLVFVCDSGSHKVQVFNLLDDCNFVREFGTFGHAEGQFNMPLGVAVNRNDEVLVSDSSNRISVFDLQGQYLRSFCTKGRKDGCLNYPINMVVSDENALYVCDQGNHRVQVLNASDGSFLHKWGGARKPHGGEEDPAAAEDAPPEDGEAEKPAELPALGRPAAVAVNAHGLIVVADYEQHMLWTF